MGKVNYTTSQIEDAVGHECGDVGVISFYMASPNSDVIATPDTATLSSGWSITSSLINKFYVNSNSINFIGDHAIACIVNIIITCKSDTAGTVVSFTIGKNGSADENRWQETKLVNAHDVSTLPLSLLVSSIQPNDEFELYVKADKACTITATTVNGSVIEIFNCQ